MRLALYAHYSESGQVALYVSFYLRKLRELGFRICFLSNSPVPASRKPELSEICEKVIELDNAGYDSAMWQRGMAEYELTQFDELLLTNSTIIGPLHPLRALWENSATRECDFWGLTDNDEFGHELRHLQSYFILFRRCALEHPCFQQFWRSILPFKNRELVIQSYEVGLTYWLQQNGLRWVALFPQQQLLAQVSSRRNLAQKLRDRIRAAPQRANTTMLLPDLLLECGSPFLKAKLLNPGGDKHWQVDAQFAMQLLESSDIPRDILEEFRIELHSSHRKQKQNP